MKHSFRQWHIWISVALALPLLLIGLTTFFIAHDKALGTKQFMVPMGWWPGYGKQLQAEKRELRAVLQTPQGLFVGGKGGLYRVDGKSATPLATDVRLDEVRALTFFEGQLWIASKTGIWQLEGEQAVQKIRSDCWGVQSLADGIAAVCKDGGWQVSRGDEWKKQKLDFPAEAAPDTRVPLSKIVMDIHTGKLFVGKAGEWAWVDLTGFALVALSLTGIILWLRRRKAAAQ